MSKLAIAGLLVVVAAAACGGGTEPAFYTLLNKRFDLYSVDGARLPAEVPAVTPTARTYLDSASMTFYGSGRVLSERHTTSYYWTDPKGYPSSSDGTAQEWSMVRSDSVRFGDFVTVFGGEGGLVRGDSLIVDGVEGRMVFVRTTP